MQLVLRELLAPRQWKAPEDRRFFLDHEQISELCEAAEAIFKDEPSVLHLKGGVFSRLELQEAKLNNAV